MLLLVVVVVEDRRLCRSSSSRCLGREGMGGRGLYSTVLDYTAVLQDLLQPSPKLLKKETVDMMFTPELQEGSAAHKAFQETIGPGPLCGGLVNEVHIGGLAQAQADGHALQLACKMRATGRARLRVWRVIG